MNGVFWFADRSDEEDERHGMPWQPFLQISCGCFSLPIWFATEEECRAFIAEIPPGTCTDSSECGHADLERLLYLIILVLFIVLLLRALGVQV